MRDCSDGSWFQEEAIREEIQDDEHALKRAMEESKKEAEKQGIQGKHLNIPGLFLILFCSELTSSSSSSSTFHIYKSTERAIVPVIQQIQPEPPPLIDLLGGTEPTLQDKDLIALQDEELARKLQQQMDLLV